MSETTKTDSTQLNELKRKLAELKITPTVDISKLALTLKVINPDALIPVDKLPEDVRSTLRTINNEVKRFHGAKISLSWFPFPSVSSPCSDKFGYLTSAQVRSASKLEFNVNNQNLLNKLGGIMGDPNREPPTDSTIPSGYTYFGQFVDHDITLDVSSTIEAATDATTINNMRSPSLELDNLYGQGPALSPFLYEFPTTGLLTAIKFKLGTNKPSGPGGPISQTPIPPNPPGMIVLTNFDVPRMSGNNTAVIGDPRNDENLIVSQFHSAMLKFHNAVVDLLIAGSFTGDIFVEAKRIVTQHYQWAVVNDYLKRICGAAAVSSALKSVTASENSAFSMPVEFSVAAYRFGHSMIRNNYWLNHNFINQPLSDVFNFIRNPRLPVFSNWVVNFNAFFDTKISVPKFNNARKIDSVLANGLADIPGGSGIMAVLATRNLRRGLALGLPSGQATATAFDITPLTSEQIISGLPQDEISILNGLVTSEDRSDEKLLLKQTLLTKTPLWYYILREAAVLGGGNSLGPLGAKIVAETFIRMLKRDSGSYLNQRGGFSPILPSAVAGDFTVADILVFAGVTAP